MCEVWRSLCTLSLLPPSPAPEPVCGLQETLKLVGLAGHSDIAPVLDLPIS